jgi:hypothetical protein
MLEQYRAVDVDRVYFIEGAKLYIKLFSANFLKAKYNREISPLNIRDQYTNLNIHFGISDNKILKPQY